MTMSERKATMITADTIKGLIEASIEDTRLPDAILSCLKRYDGKRLTQPIVDRIAADPSVHEDLYLRREYGWTQLESVTYRRTQGHTGVSLILARQERNVVIDAAWIEAENAPYFAAARARNATRREALANIAALDDMATAINVIRQHTAILDSYLEASPYSQVAHAIRGLLR